MHISLKKERFEHVHFGVRGLRSRPITEKQSTHPVYAAVSHKPTYLITNFSSQMSNHAQQKIRWGRWGSEV